MIDDQSEPGSWARHLRDTECMRAECSPDNRMIGGAQEPLTNRAVDRFAHKDGSREARPVCTCQRNHAARITPDLTCDCSGEGCPYAK